MVLSCLINSPQQVLSPLWHLSCYWRCGTAKSCQRQLGWHACPLLSTREETLSRGVLSLRLDLSEETSLILTSPRLQDKFGNVPERITSQMLKVIQEGTRANRWHNMHHLQQNGHGNCRPLCPSWFSGCQGLHVFIGDRPSVEFRARTSSSTKNSPQLWWSDVGAGSARSMFRVFSF